MNIIEIAKTMKNGQIASSKSLDLRVALVEDYYLHYVSHDDDSKLDRIEFNANEWSAEDWEIEIVWVDFWTAWNARINEKKKIRSEYWYESIHFDSNLPSGDKYLNEQEINGKWQIFD